MSESLFSPSWYRVVDMKPRLRKHANIHRHYYRGHRWYVLQDSSSGRFHRFTPETHYIINQMNGERTVQDIWENLLDKMGDDAPTQEEIIQLLSHLHGADILQTDISPDSEELFRRYQLRRRIKWKRLLSNPMALRFPLIDPEKFLNVLLPVVRPFFSWWGAMIWLVVIIFSLFSAGAHWTELTGNVIDKVLTPQNLLVLWLVYPVVKALHELGHAFATKVWGGEVHEMGVMLLVFIPIPYVDASSSHAFVGKHRRIVVSSAGMIVELLLASVALFVWLNVETGLMSNIAFNVMLIGGVSTLIFNGNPLLRFDGYYILSDAIEIPNLGSRANKYLAYLAQRYLLGVTNVLSPANTSGEKVWFVIYGICSYIYRMIIFLAIALYVSGKFFIVGILLASWALLHQIIIPLIKICYFVLASPNVMWQRGRSIAVSVGMIVSGLVVIFLIPVPFGTMAEGVIGIPEQAYVRAGTDCFITSLLLTDGDKVETGQALIECEDPFLQANVKRLKYKKEELVASLNAVAIKDRVKAETVKDELMSVEAELARAYESRDELVIRSPTQGIFNVPVASDMPGLFVHQGDVVGHVINPQDIIVTVVVTQSDVSLVQERSRLVEVRLADQVMEPIRGMIKRQIPAASDRLPSRVLGSPAGGAIAVDPADSEGLRTLKKVYQFEIELVSVDQIKTVGGRVFVRFGHGYEPIALRWSRSLRQLFLRQFNV